ncbi:triose-phosphate isomerase [Parvularcula dongshanensis]|uniref:Triosephosphate isomerase n=1 Tax=Parvularcula dongshanensis TaxID=1173995 RepID=A0A840I5W3_9PROT|nr:triose-phosphate isomerase [Parvularcula dongshanensis]MBB4659802.1 triosephosphate isomerase [Parvularcula dongshanensis]
MRRLIVGNWKMNGLRGAEKEITRLGELLTPDDRKRADVVVCPPATLLGCLVEEAAAAGIELGGQNCHIRPSGAHTGEVSAEMLADAGAKWCIVGHSERRQDHGERSALVRAKAEAALRAGLTPIICVGEKPEDHEAGRAEAVVGSQIEVAMPNIGISGGRFVTAYEPIWAVGTGVVPRPSHIEAIHARIRKTVGPDTPILYGGSVKGKNAGGILSIPNVDGALIGGASLKAEDFHEIISARWTDHG